MEVFPSGGRDKNEAANKRKEIAIAPAVTLVFWKEQKTVEREDHSGDKIGNGGWTFPQAKKTESC